MRNENENEVSGGQVFGFILLGATALFVISFIAFVVIKNVSGSKSAEANTTAVEQTVDTNVE